MKFITFTHLVALLAFAFASHSGFSQLTGNIDGSFGDEGKLWYNWIGDGSPSFMTEFVLDENSESFYFSGSINSEGLGINAIIVKADLDGVLDPTLEAGTIEFDPYALDDRFESVAIQPNGKIVAVGYSILGPGYSEVIITRYNTAGAFDDTFNGGTPLNIDMGAIGGLDLATDVAIQEDGKIVVLGSLQSGESDIDPFFMRLNIDGSLDDTFGTEGLFHFDTYFGFELFTDLIILDNGSIMAVGQTGDEALIVQLDTEGNFDEAFNIDGKMQFKLNGLITSANKIIQLSDGSLLLSGNTANDEEDGNNGFVIKMEADGDFATDFNGDDGALILNFESEMGLDTNFFLRDMEVLASGEILIAADYASDTQDIGLVLLNEFGEIDTDFGENGMRLYNLSAESLANKDAQIEVASTGAIYLSGRVINGPIEDIVTFRIFGNMVGVFEETPATINLKLYPNPVRDALNIQVDLATSENVSIQILNVMGSVVAKEQLMGLPIGQSTISISSNIEQLAAGSYWLSITTKETTTTQLFIKE